MDVIDYIHKMDVIVIVSYKWWNREGEFGYLVISWEKSKEMGPDDSSILQGCDICHFAGACKIFTLYMGTDEFFFLFLYFSANSIINNSGLQFQPVLA